MLAAQGNAEPSRRRVRRSAWRSATFSCTAGTWPGPRARTRRCPMASRQPYELVHGKFTDEQRKGIFKPEVPIGNDVSPRTGCSPTPAAILVEPYAFLLLSARWISRRWRHGRTPRRPRSVRRRVGRRRPRRARRGRRAGRSDPSSFVGLLAGVRGPCGPEPQPCREVPGRAPALPRRVRLSTPNRDSAMGCAVAEQGKSDDAARGTPRLASSAKGSQVCSSYPKPTARSPMSSTNPGCTTPVTPRATHPVDVARAGESHVLDTRRDRARGPGWLRSTRRAQPQADVADGVHRDAELRGRLPHGCPRRAPA